MYITLGFVPGILSFTVPKFAVILLLCNLLNPSRLHRWFLWTMAAINFIAIVVCIAIVYASCDPPYAMWTLSVVPKCWDPNVVVYSSVFAGGRCPPRFFSWEIRSAPVDRGRCGSRARWADSRRQHSPPSWTCTSPYTRPLCCGSCR